MAETTLCWDCSRAIGGCSWSDEGKPVRGWTAKGTQKTSTKPYNTYLVIDCPLFDRDAYGGGLKKYKKENENESV